LLPIHIVYSSKQSIMRIFTIACFILLSFNLFGQYESSNDSDPKAVELLEQIKENFYNAPGHLIDFSLVMEFPGQAMETQSGNLVQSKEKFILDMPGQKIICDNETVWMYLKDMNEVQINDMEISEATDFMSPSDLFNLHKSKDFVFAIMNYGSEEGKAITQIECKPLSEDSEYSKMRLTITDKDLGIKRLKIFSKDGSRFTMHIKSHDPDYALDTDTFTFDEANFPGVHVEDLRFD